MTTTTIIAGTIRMCTLLITTTIILMETQPGWAATQLLVARLQLRVNRDLGYRKLVVYVESPFGQNARLLFWGSGGVAVITWRFTVLTALYAVHRHSCTV